MLNLTERAASKVKGLLEAKGIPQGGLRVFVVGGGCAGYSYGMALAREWEEDDVLLDLQGVRLVVDLDSAKLLEGAEIDYIEDVMRSGFSITNPNATHACACGSSFSAEGGTPKPCGH